MCDPSVVFAGQALLQLGGAFAKSNADMAAYSKKIEAGNRQADAVIVSTVFKFALDGLRQAQVQDQATIREGQARAKLSAAQGEAAAAAASGGIEGNSVRQLFRSYAVATGSDIAGFEADAEGQIAQAQNEKRADEMSARNQLLAIKEALPDDPSASIVANYVGAALGVGKSFVQNTTPITDKSLRTGGLFGGGGFLGTGRSFG